MTLLTTAGIAAQPEIVPGISVELFPGHTAQMLGIHIESASQHACYIGDLIPTAHHLDPTWVMGYDLDPVECIAQRKRFLPARHPRSSGRFLFPPRPPHPRRPRLPQRERQTHRSPPVVRWPPARERVRPTALPRHHARTSPQLHPLADHPHRAPRAQTPRPPASPRYG